MQTTHELITTRGEERYESYRLFEEKTDLGERLSLPIENRLELEVVDGGVYGRDIDGKLRRMTDWAQEAYENTLSDPAFTGANAVECIRRKHEYDEALEVEMLKPGDVLVVFSPIPDAALAGMTSIAGYRTDLARTFCRLYRRSDTAVESVTLSLEQSDKAALQAAAASIGMALPQSMQSEAVLAARYVMSLSRDDYEFLPGRIREKYDESLRRTTGQTFYAGNALANRQDSMRFIEANHDIIDEHLAVLRSVEARFERGAFRDDALEMLRRRTAAALDERLHGGMVASISDASVGDRMEAHDYGGECATGATQSAQEQMGLAQGKHTTNCPLCHAQGITATVEGETITCSDCAGSVDICSGKVTYGKPKKQDPAHQSVYRKKNVQRPATKQAIAEARYGEKVILKKELTIGGQRTVAMNKRGEIKGYI